MRRIRGLVLAVLVVLIAALALEAWSPDWWRRLSYPLDYEPSIKATGKRYAVDPYLIAAMIRVESSFDPEVKSPKGAVGLMQVLPSTARYVEKRRGNSRLTTTLARPAYNIDIGTAYFRYLVDRYGTTEYALAAYNGGETNVDKWIAGREDDKPRDVVRDFPFSETRAFVKKVLDTRLIYLELYPEAF